MLGVTSVSRPSVIDASALSSALNFTSTCSTLQAGFSYGLFDGFCLLVLRITLVTFKISLGVNKIP